MDTVGQVRPRSSGCQSSKVGGSSSSVRDALSPGVEAHQVDSDRRGHVLQMGLGEPAVPCAAQFEGADRLREGALDAGPAAVASLPVLRLLVLANVLQGLVVGVRAELQEARRASDRPCTERAGQRRQSVRENLTVMTGLPQASGCGVHEVLVRPCGQVAVCADQSMVNWLRSYRPGAWACQLLLGRMGSGRPDRRRRSQHPAGARWAVGPWLWIATSFRLFREFRDGRPGTSRC